MRLAQTQRASSPALMPAISFGTDDCFQ